MPDPIIQIENLSLWYGGYQALDDVTEEIRPGACVVICGPSGSGKSSLLRCINGLEQFQRGDVVVGGTSVRRCRDLPRLRSNVGMVFQHFELYPHMTVLDNVTLAPRKVKNLSKAQADDRARRLLEQVGMGDQAHKHPATLSGGQQQRAAIARALALEPKVMLFDEPTSALDPEMIAEVLRAMRDLAREGMTMLVVTHEMTFAREVADEIMFMNDGRVVERGETAAFFANPRFERTKEFLDKLLLKA